MGRIFGLYRRYALYATANWPMLWALRVEIPIAFALLALVYSIAAYFAASSVTRGGVPSLTDSGYLTNLVEAIDAWLSWLAFTISGAGFLLWTAAVMRSLPLSNAPRLRVHPEGARLCLLALVFVLWPLLTGISLHAAFGIRWGSLIESYSRIDRLSINLVSVAIVCGIATFGASFCAIGKLDNIARASASVFVLLTAIVALSVIVGAVLELSVWHFFCSLGVLVISVLVITVSFGLVLSGSRFRVFVAYPALLACNSGFIVLILAQIAKEGAWGRLMDPQVQGSIFPILLGVGISVLVCAAETSILRRQLSRPWQ